MGTKIEEIKFDDVTGQPGDDVRPFSIVVEGVRYTLDACDETRQDIRRVLDKYLSKASVKQTDGTADDPRLVRQWARQNGYRVQEKGRIPDKIIQDYHAQNH